MSLHISGKLGKTLTIPFARRWWILGAILRLSNSGSISSLWYKLSLSLEDGKNTRWDNYPQCFITAQQLYNPDFATSYQLTTKGQIPLPIKREVKKHTAQEDTTIIGALESQWCFGDTLLNGPHYLLFKLPSIIQPSLGIQWSTSTQRPHLASTLW